VTMLPSRLQRTPWQLACLLFATTATASVAPSNSSTAGDFQGTLPLQHADGNQAQMAEVVPLTQRAKQYTVRLVLFLPLPAVTQADGACT
jgi:hypothetical protein